MTTNYLCVRVDMENNAETWWDALRERYPAFARSLEREDQAVIAELLLDSLQALPGWQDGPAYAPTALLVEEGRAVSLRGRSTEQVEVFDELS